MPSSLLDKIWAAHEVADGLIYIDMHLLHEVTSPQGFRALRLAGRAVHVIGPEQGLTQPGMTIVCGDSHTSTHGFEAEWDARPWPGPGSLDQPAGPVALDSEKRGTGW